MGVSRRCTEWRPRHAATDPEGYWRTALGELNHRWYDPSNNVQIIGVNGTLAGDGGDVHKRCSEFEGWVRP